jgi:anti-anti-sigma regulatory factor
VAGDVRVDLTGLVWADASLMLDLAMLSGRVRKRGGAMIIHGAQPQIARLIELVGLHRLPSVSFISPPAPSPAGA